MKTFVKKHKILLIALSAVLCVGIFSGLLLAGVINLSKSGSSFKTVADAKEETNAPAKAPNAGQEDEPVQDLTQPVPTPTPAPKETKLSADEVKRITETVQRRRRTIIPVRSNIWKPDNAFLWTKSEPRADQIDSAQSAAEYLTQILFGQTYESLTGYDVSNAKVSIFTDTTGDRTSFFRVTDPNESYVLTIRESNQQLINADLLTYPDGDATDREKENTAIAEKLGYTVKPYRHESGMPNEVIYVYRTDKDAFLLFAYIGNMLWQVSVFPNEQTMSESEYFLADLQYDYSREAYPRNFVETEPPQLGYDKMINDGKIFAALARMYKNLSGNELDTSKLTAQFLRDESGAREDCWRITGEGFDITVSAYSRDVISFKAEIPCKDLLSIPYEKMGEKEYEDATAIIAQYFITSLGAYGEGFSGKDVKEISVNAVYDGNYCTMDIVTQEGTWYECYFEGGVLKEIWHFANEKMFWVGINTGWVADAVYINEATGKPFIPDYRDWDGDLYISPRPEAN